MPRNASDDSKSSGDLVIAEVLHAVEVTMAAHTWIVCHLNFLGRAPTYVLGWPPSRSAKRRPLTYSSEESVMKFFMLPRSGPIARSHLGWRLFSLAGMTSWYPDRAFLEKVLLVKLDKDEIDFFRKSTRRIGSLGLISSSVNSFGRDFH